MYYPSILWQQKPAIALRQCPAYLLSWLLTEGSMTERMRRQSVGELQVKIIKQSWQHASWEESQHLGIAMRSQVLSREVVLYGGVTPWMYARSLFPHQLFQGKDRWLQRALNQQPIGEVLYRHPKMYRDDFQFAKVERHHWGCKNTESYTGISLDHLWARRSRFYLHHSPLLLTEFFLPMIGE